MQKPSRLLVFFVLSLFSFCSVGGFSPGLFASIEITSTPTGYTAVQTLEQVQANASTPAASPVSTPEDDFFNANPLSAAEEENIAGQPIPEVLKAEAEVYLESGNFDYELALSNDTYYGTYPMWGFSRVDVERAWSLSRGAGVTIAVIDTGLDYYHEDIQGNIYTNNAEYFGIPGVDDDGDGLIDDIHGWDFVNNDNSPFDDNGHGTHVSGIAAAVSDNGKGIAGVAPDAKILPVKVLDAGGSGTIQNVIKGIKYAADLGAKIINMSLGIAKRYLTNPLLQEFQNAINYALGKGSIVVTAAGNESVETSTTAPAGLNYTIAVGATDSNNKRAYFSNKSPDLVAPGVNIGSLYPGNRYVYLSGTSMSSPFVAGAAAILYSYYNSTYSAWSGAQIYNDIYTRLTRSALDLGKKGYDANFGYGLLDVYGALTFNVSSVSNSNAGNKNSTGVFSPSSKFGFGARSFSYPETIANPALDYLTRLSLGNWYKISALESHWRKKTKKHKYSFN